MAGALAPPRSPLGVRVYLGCQYLEVDAGAGRLPSHVHAKLNAEARSEAGELESLAAAAAVMQDICEGTRPPQLFEGRRPFLSGRADCSSPAKGHVRMCTGDFPQGSAEELSCGAHY